MVINKKKKLMSQLDLTAHGHAKMDLVWMDNVCARIPILELSAIKKFI